MNKIKENAEKQLLIGKEIFLYFANGQTTHGYEGTTKLEKNLCKNCILEREGCPKRLCQSSKQ